MDSTSFVLALAFCFIAVASRSPTQPVIFIATVALAAIASAGARKRRNPVSSASSSSSSSFVVLSYVCLRKLVYAWTCIFPLDCNEGFTGTFLDLDLVFKSAASHTFFRKSAMSLDPMGSTLLLLIFFF